MSPGSRISQSDASPHDAVMRAIVMHRVGGPEVLELENVPVPAPGAGDVLIELHARGVNFADAEWRLRCSTRGNLGALRG